MGGQLAGRNQRGAADITARRVAILQRQKFGIAPHIELATGEIVPAHRLLQGIIVKGYFQGRKALFAEGPRGIAPSLATFFTSQFVDIGHVLPSRPARECKQNTERHNRYVALGQQGGENEKPSLPKCLEGLRNFLGTLLAL